MAIDTEHLVILGIAPAADPFASTVYTTAVNMKNYSKANAYILKGVGTTGTSTVTVEKNTAADGTGAAAIPFYYRRITSAGVAGAWTLATTSGFTTTAGSGETYELAWTDKMEGLALGDKPYVRVKMAEVVDSAVLGAVLVIASGGRYGKDG